MHSHLLEALHSRRLKIFQRSLDASFGFAFFYHLSFIKFFLAPRDRELELYFVTLIIQLNRHQCQALLFLFPREMSDFFFVEQETARTVGLITGWRVFLLVGRDSETYDVCFLPADEHARAFEVCVSFYNGFHFKAQKLESCLKLLEYFIVKICLFVFGKRHTTSLDDDKKKTSALGTRMTTDGVDPAVKTGVG